MDFRITKNGEVQARVHSGTGVILSGFKVQSGNKIAELTSNLTTTSTSFTTITSFELGETKYSKLKEFLTYLYKNKAILLQLFRFRFDFGFGMD